MPGPERLTIPTATGHALAARLDRPAAPVRGYALFAHCFTCSKDLFAASRIASALAERGIAVLRFDFTGLGHSGGEFASTDFSSNLDDLRTVADWMREHLSAPGILIGHSLGGAAVLAVAADVPECRAVATIGAPADPAHVTHLFEHARPEIEREGEAEVTLAGRSFRIRRALLEDLAGQRQDERIARLRRALLILHSPVDEVVALDHARRIYEQARHPKSFVSLDGADHLLTRREDAEYVAGVIAAWSARYLEAPPARQAGPAPVEGAVVVAGTGAGIFPQHVVTGAHRFNADEPISAGGTDTGPSPYDLLAAALGACTAMTLRMYADRRGLELDQATVTVRHDRIHAEDCADCESGSGKVDRFQRTIALEGSLDAAARARLLEIANRCPVHRTLENEIRIETVLTEPA